MRSIVAVLAAIGCLSSPVAAQTGGEISVGMRIHGVHDVNLADQTYRAFGAVWFRHRDATFDAASGVQLGLPGELRLAPRVRTRLPDGEYYQELGFEARVHHPLNPTEYPYDVHALALPLQPVPAAAARTFRADAAASGRAAALLPSGWDISQVSVAVTEAQPAGLAQGRPVQQIEATVHIERTTRRALFDHFVGFFVAQILCLLGFLVAPTQLQPRITLAAAAVFAAIGYKLVNNSLFGAHTPMLSSSLSVGSFAMIVTYLIATIFLWRVADGGRIVEAKRWNQIAAAAFVMVWLVSLAVIFSRLRGFAAPGMG